QPYTPPSLGDVDFKDEIVQNDVTVGGSLYTLRFTNPDTIRGGRLQLKATAIVSGNSVSGVTPPGLRINGTNPQRSTIQTYIDQRSGIIPQVSDTDAHNALKRMACRESGGGGQIQ